MGGGGGISSRTEVLVVILFDHLKNKNYRECMWCVCVRWERELGVH